MRSDNGKGEERCSNRSEGIWEGKTAIQSSFFVYLIKSNGMINDINSLDLSKRYSYADYLTWKLDEYVELIRGKVFKMSPAPSSLHQLISSRLLRYFLPVTDHGSCEVFHAPFDVRLFPSQDDSENDTVVQPDICVVCDPEKIDARGCVGAPDLIVEIISPSSSKRDVQDKYELYQEAGVPEYWIVIPEVNLVEVFHLKDGKYDLKKQYSANDQLTPMVFPQLSIDLGRVFRKG